MTLVGIDPGPEETAWAMLDARGAIVKFEKCPSGRLQQDLLMHLGLADRVAIEMIASYGMPVGKEVFDTCVWIGRFIEQVPEPAKRLQPVRLVYRAEVKSHLCHSQKANDANIRQALIDKFGPPGRKKTPGATYGISGDCWSALAVAVAAMETPAKPENLRR